MKLFIQTIILLALPVLVFAQATWDGGGDGTSWDDPSNWLGDALPQNNDTITFSIDATITGTSNIVPIQVSVQNGAKVNFELDMTVGSESSDIHTFLIGKSTEVYFGNGTDAYSFEFLSSTGKHGLANFASGDSAYVEMTENAQFLFNNHNLGINIAGPATTVVNNANILFQGDSKYGMRVKGSFVNNGIINSIGSYSQDVIQVLGGSFVNGETGNISMREFADDGIEVEEGGVFENYGIIGAEMVADLGSANNSIATGTKDNMGDFINFGTGRISINAGTGTDTRGIYVFEMGTMENYGVITVSGGNANNRIYSRNYIINHEGGVLDLDDGRMNINAGNFVNNSYIKAYGGTSGVYTNEGTEVTNNAFFRYDSSGVFAIGMGTIVDNGLKANKIDRVKLDAGDACSIDVAETAFDWTLDGEFLVSSEDDGSLTFNPETITSDTVVLKTIIPDFTLKIENVCDAAIISALWNMQTEKRLTVYPTIVSQSESIMIESPNTIQTEIAIFNMTGQQLFSGTAKTNTLIELPENLPLGMNFIQVQYEDSFEIHKIIVQ